ncbi:hypothetical protein WMF20_46165 [Sorangium sp. So ce834]|uniref:hypothetical protein n=1 Tax=Sorangium sp. So ce834 TaxID=3133321 RepID=UPI003F5E36A2
MDGDDQRPEAHLLEARHGEQRHIEAVRELVLQDAIGEADLLPHLLEARWHLGIRDAEALERLVERGDHGRDAGCGAALVAVERVVARGPAESVANLAEQEHDDWMVRRDEHREQRRRRAQPGPLVVREYVDGAGASSESLSPGDQLPCDPGTFGFGDGAQSLRWQGEIHDSEVDGLAAVHSRHWDLHRHAELRGELNGEHRTFEGRRAAVPDLHGRDDGHSRLLEGERQGPGMLELDSDRRLLLDCHACLKACARRAARSRAPASLSRPCARGG